MGAHSNYVTINNDAITALTIAGIIIALYLVFCIVSRIKDRREYERRKRIYRRKINALQEANARERAKTNFYRNRVEEDMEEILKKEGLI